MYHKTASEDQSPGREISSSGAPQPTRKVENLHAHANTGSKGDTFVRKNYPSYILPCKIHNLVILIIKFAQCNLCEFNLNSFLLVRYAVFLDLDLCARIVRRQVSKTAEHAWAVPAINVTKWQTTNKVLPRSFASRQSARGEFLVKNMGSVKRTSLLVCLGVSSEKSVVIIHMIILFILLLLVKMFATTQKRSGLSFSCWLRSAVAG